MKTAISIPNSIFEAAESFAKRLGVSRSQLYTNAVSEYIRENRYEQVTKKLNEVYTKESSHLDPVLYELQSASLIKKDWQCLEEKFGGPPFPSLLLLNLATDDQY